MTELKQYREKLEALTAESETTPPGCAYYPARFGWDDEAQIAANQIGQALWKSHARPEADELAAGFLDLTRKAREYLETHAQIVDPRVKP